MHSHTAGSQISNYASYLIAVINSKQPDHTGVCWTGLKGSVSHVAATLTNRFLSSNWLTEREIHRGIHRMVFPWNSWGENLQYFLSLFHARHFLQLNPKTWVFICKVCIYEAVFFWLNFFHQTGRKYNQWPAGYLLFSGFLKWRRTWCFQTCLKEGNTQ